MDGLDVVVKVVPDEASARATVKRIEDILGTVGKGSTASASGSNQALIQQKRDTEQHFAKIKEITRRNLQEQNQEVYLYQQKGSAAYRQAQIQQRRDLQEHLAKQRAITRQAQIQQKRDLELYLAKNTSLKGSQNLMAAATPGSSAERQLTKLHEQALKLDAVMNKGFLVTIQERLRKVALLTTEVTRAFFGLSAVIAGVGLPAIFGVKYLKDIEDAKMGMVGTLITMGKFTEGADKYSVAMGVATETTKTLESASIRFGIPLTDIVGTFRAVVASGLNAGMTLEEIGKAATIASVAVKSLGLDSRQVVQETRDLFMGGIQPASSTLATSLNLRDSDIKKAKERAAAGIESFYDFIMKKLEGYEVVAGHRAETLSGAFDVLIIKMQRLASDSGTFSAVKDLVNQVSDSIGILDKKTNQLTLNPDALSSMEKYLNLIKWTIGELSIIIGLVSKFGGALLDLGIILGGLKVASLVWGTMVAQQTLLVGAISKVKIAYAQAAVAAEISAAAQGAAISGIGLKAAALTTTLRASIGTLGLVGLAAWGLYEIADHMGWIDEYFTSFDTRVKQSKMALQGLGRDALLTKQQELTKQILDEETKIKSSTKLSSKLSQESMGVMDTHTLTKLKAEKMAVDKQLEELTKPKQVDFSQQQKGLQSWLTEQSKTYKTAYTINKEYADKLRAAKVQIDVAQKALESPITPDIGLPEAERAKDIADRLNIKKQELATAKEIYSLIEKDREKQLKSLDKPSAESMKAQREAIAELQDSYKSAKLLEKNRLTAEQSRLDSELATIDLSLASGTKAVTKAEEEKTNAMYFSNLQQRSIIEAMREQAKQDYESAKSLGNANAARDAANRYASTGLELLAKENEGQKILSDQLQKTAAERKEELDAIYSSQKAMQDNLSDYELEQASIHLTTLELTKLKNARVAEKELRDRIMVAGPDGQSIVNPNITEAQKKQYEDEIKQKQELADLTAEQQSSFMYGWQESFNSYKNSAEDAAGAARDAFKTASQSMTDGIVEFAKTGKLSFNSFVVTVLEGLLKIQAQKASAGLLGMATEFITSMFSSTASGTGAGTAQAGSLWGAASAKGNIFDGMSRFAKGAAFSAMLASTPVAFANGGAFTNNVFNQPTAFKFATGAGFSNGVMGEAGPEAVMPLKRGPDGSLGVQASGTGGVNVSVQVNINSDGSSTTETQSEEDGKAIGELVSNAVRTELIKEMRSGGLLDKNRRN